MPLCPDYFNQSRAYLVGITTYKFFRPLFTPIRDVNAVASLLQKHEFSEINIKTVPNATKKAFEELVVQMQAEIGERDRVLFYFAGHGMAYPNDFEPKGYLIPANGEKDIPDSYISMEWLVKEFSKLPCKHLLLILDCCFAGAIRWGDIYRNTGQDQLKKIYREKFERFVDDKTKAWQVITSSSYDEEAIDGLLQLGIRDPENTKPENSPFAGLLIEVLDGRAHSPNNFSDGIITATRLHDYLDRGIAEYLESKALSHKQTPYYFPLRRGEKGQFIFLDPGKPDAVINLSPIEINNPYKGLSSYQNEDSNLFFGREKPVQKLKQIFFRKERDRHKQATNEWKITLVSGASGVGKSSLIMAGFIPQMASFRYIKPIRPGNIKQMDNYIDKCRLEIAAVTGPYILFIDQFEEMVTICSGDERALFEGLILQSLEEGNCRIIISVRSDFEAQFKDTPFLKSALENKFTVPPFQRDEIEAIIVQPALQSLIEIESIENDEKGNAIFIDNIIDEVMQSAGGMPLLSFALEEWYERSVKQNDNQRILLEKDYQVIGGVNGALSSIVEKFSAGLNDTEKLYLKRLLLRMVKAEDGSYARRKIYQHELNFNEPSYRGRSTTELLKELIHLRIITSNINDTERKYSREKIFYEPAHDSLLTSWKQLQEWIDKEGLGKIIVYRQLANDVENWTQNQKQKKYLWHDGSSLDVVSREFIEPRLKNSKIESYFVWLQGNFTFGPEIKETKTHVFNIEESKFIRESLKSTRGGKIKLNLTLATVIVALVVSVILGWSTYRQSIKNRALYLSSESDKYGDIEKLALLKAAWNINPDSAIADKIYSYINSYEYFDPIPIANFTCDRLFDSISFKNDSTVTVFTGNGHKMEWSLSIGTVLKDIVVSPRNFVKYDDSSLSINVIDSYSGTKKSTRLKGRELLDYHMTDSNLVVISTSENDSHIDYFNKNGHTSILVEDKYTHPVFLHGRKFIWYEKVNQNIITDFSGNIIDSSIYFENVHYVRQSGNDIYGFRTIFLGTANSGQESLSYYNIKNKKIKASRFINDVLYTHEPQIDFFQKNDSICVIAFRYEGNEGSDRGNGQSTRIRIWNINSNKMVNLYNEDKYYDHLEFVNDSTVFFSDTTSIHKLLFVNSGKTATLNLQASEIRSKNNGKYFYFVNKTQLGFTSYLYDFRLRKVFSTEYSSKPVSESISVDNRFIVIGFIDKHVYIWKLSNYFDPKPDDGTLTDRPSADNFEIKPDDFNVANDGSMVSIRGQVNTGSGGINFDYYSDPANNGYKKSDSFAKSYKSPYAEMKFKDIGISSKELINQVANFNALVEKRFGKNSLSCHYADCSIYFINNKIVIATPPEMLEVIKEESLRIVAGRLFENGNKVIYVLQNGEIHYLRTRSNFYDFIKKIKLSPPEKIKLKYKLR